jgi:23S rRNA pseudouridine2605 synthase
MTPKNKKKFRKQIADSKRHATEGVRFTRKKHLDDDAYRDTENREIKYSFNREKAKRFKDDDPRKRFTTQNEHFGKKPRSGTQQDRKNAYNKSETTRGIKPDRYETSRRYYKNETQKKSDDKKHRFAKMHQHPVNTPGSKQSNVHDEEQYRVKNTYKEKNAGRYLNPQELTEQRGVKKYYTGEKKYAEPRTYKAKIHFEDDRRNRFIDDESPLKKNRKTSDNRKYTSYERGERSEPKIKRGTPQEMRLNKYLAHCGIAARRKADELIENGQVKVNGTVVKEMGYKVQPGDEVRYKGRLVTPGEKIYILLNKPKDYITTADDERGRKTVLDLIEGATEERVFPVGRLDRNTTGLLLLTNDGELAQKLSHPSFGVKKVYAVELDKPLTVQHFKMISEGVKLEDGVAVIDEIAYTNSSDKRNIGIMLHVGKNRIVRRIFEHLGYAVVKLDRTFYAGLEKRNLERGRWRYLTAKEINQLYRFK